MLCELKIVVLYHRVISNFIYTFAFSTGAELGGSWGWRLVTPAHEVR